jgi:hypothetical protein
VSALAEPANLGEQPSLTTGTYLASWLAHARGRVQAKAFDGYEALIRLYKFGGEQVSQAAFLQLEGTKTACRSP